MPSRTGEPGFSRFRVGETDVVLSKGFKSLEATCSFKANKPMSLLSIPSEKALNRKGRLKERRRRGMERVTADFMKRARG